MLLFLRVLLLGPFLSVKTRGEKHFSANVLCFGQVRMDLRMDGYDVARSRNHSCYLFLDGLKTKSGWHCNQCQMVF